MTLTPNQLAELAELVQQYATINIEESPGRCCFCAIDFTVDDSKEDCGFCHQCRTDTAAKVMEHLPDLLRLAAQHTRLVEFVNDMTEYDCPYQESQPCLSVHISKLSHGMCDGCKARAVLKEIADG